MQIGLVSAPSNLGLRPPAPTSVPGCAKAPEALREAGLHRRLAELGAEDRGVVLPGRYADDATPGRLRNHVAIVEHSRRRAPGRYGLVHLDGHTDFRNPGNSGQCASLAGEDLAAAVGLHWPAIADIDGLSPYFSPGDTAHAGCRDDDEQFQEASALLGAVLPASQIRHLGVAHAARTILGVADRAD